VGHLGKIRLSSAIVHTLENQTILHTLAFVHVGKTPHFIDALALVHLGTTTKALATPLAKPDNYSWQNSRVHDLWLNQTIGVVSYTLAKPLDMPLVK